MRILISYEESHRVYSDALERALVGGRRWQRPNPTLEDLLWFIEEVEALLLRERDPNGC